VLAPLGFTDEFSVAELDVIALAANVETVGAACAAADVVKVISLP